MDDFGTKIDFGRIAWKRIRKGGMVGRAKVRLLNDGRTVRLLEISPEWNEEGWCKKEHTGYVLSGELRLDFRSKNRKALLIKHGQSFYVPLGAAHKASSKSTTTVYIVDWASGS